MLYSGIRDSIVFYAAFGAWVTNFIVNENVEWQLYPLEIVSISLLITFSRIAKLQNAELNDMKVFHFHWKHINHTCTPNIQELLLIYFGHSLDKRLGRGLKKCMGHKSIFK